MAVRGAWIVTALTTMTAACFGQSPVRPLDPNADRLAELNGLIRVPSTVVDISDGLLTALAGMRAADESWGLFMSPSSRGWNSASEWAMSDATQHVIAKAIELTDPEERRAIGLRYGTEGVDETWVRAGLAIDAGESGLIHTMNYGYLEGLSGLFVAMSVEAWSAAESGDSARVSELILAWTRLARIVGDREMSDEKIFCYEMLGAAMQRLRDVVYSHPGLYDEEGLREIIEALSNEEIELDEIRMPRGERLEALQMIERTMEPEGGVDPAKFGLVLASGAVPEERPLELFAMTARMNRAGETHEGWFSTFDELNKIMGDWETRWETGDFFDASLRRPSDYSGMSTTRYALLESTVGPISGLFDMRMDALMELFGTRSALGVLAFADRSNRFPPALRAVAPQFVAELDVDPWSHLKRFRRDIEAAITRDRFEKSDVFRYLVPIRDQRWGPREERVPYEITVTTGMPALEGGEEESSEDGSIGASFPISFDQSVFLLYSVWENHDDDGARLVGPEGTDYLIWPPVPSLMREAGN